jgi:hypothetical protein
LHQALPVFLDHRSGQFLDEERHTAGALHQCFHGLRAKGMARRHHVHHLLRFMPLEWCQRDHGVMRAVRPHRPKLGPARDDHHERHGGTPLGQHAQQIERRGIGPMDVFDKEDDRLRASASNHPASQSGDEPSAPLIGGGRRRRIILRHRQFQERRHQRHRLLGIEAYRAMPGGEHGNSALQIRLLRLKPPLGEFDEGMERRVL